MMRRSHNMPFGAELQEHGVRFRIWAPAAQGVELCLARFDREETLPMLSLPDGWFELLVAEVFGGQRYRYRLDGQAILPDPASRFNPDDVHQASQVIDPCAYRWNDSNWRGRPWEEAVIYELHVGCFTPQGTFMALVNKLDYLVELGVTAIELMPVADFPGARNWGYDGVLPFAPDSTYGKPDELKFFIDSAHRKGLMVLLDVVYNHFGPEGNYLHQIAPQFFTERHHTPWGAAINFDGKDSGTVRDFFIHNALYWLEEFNFDGLRLDAVHAILDDSRPDFLTTLAQAVHAGPGRERYIHLILENDHNAAHYLEREESGISSSSINSSGHPRWYTAQWNDDIHHVLHLLVTGEADSYYADYADYPMAHLGRCLTQGFSYQGEVSHFRQEKTRGEASSHLPPTAFISFLQNHDQVGNRAYGERLSMLTDARALRAVTAIMLLAPSPPLLFMGEEFAASQPFQFFCDFGPDLAAAVTQGRRREFAHFANCDPALIPDPSDPATFARSKLDWDTCNLPPHSEWLAQYRFLLQIRQTLIVPHLSAAALSGGSANFQLIGERGLEVHWHLGSGRILILLANLGELSLHDIRCPPGILLYPNDDAVLASLVEQRLAPWTVAWFLHETTEEETTEEIGYG